jgi:dTDP-4-dehydrorhamnose reductase
VPWSPTLCSSATSPAPWSRASSSGKLLHISTDYVYGGLYYYPAINLWGGHDKTTPDTFYGLSKLMGEEIVLQTAALTPLRATVVRTGGVFSAKAPFLRDVLAALQNKQHFRAFDDVLNTPTSVVHLADTLLKLAVPSQRLALVAGTGRCRATISPCSSAMS